MIISDQKEYPVGSNFFLVLTLKPGLNCCFFDDFYMADNQQYVSPEKHKGYFSKNKGYFKKNKGYVFIHIVMQKNTTTNRINNLIFLIKSDRYR